MMRWIVLIYVILQLCKVVCSTQYEWTKNAITYPSADTVLQNHVLKEYTTKHLLTQCAMECLKNVLCMSYNFDSTIKTCQLNSATHVDFPGDVAPSSFQYFMRDAYNIDPAALGLCVPNPCLNDGLCIDTKSASGDPIYMCICSSGWAGVHCDLPEAEPVWSVWDEWEACSVTCGTGWHHRTRHCVEQTSGNPRSVMDCYGNDVDYQSCTLQPCPVWDVWGQWEDCSTTNSCGKGTKIRHRECANSGTPGVDRYCLGATNQTSPCNEISCSAPLQLANGVNYGEGQVLLYNDLTDEWGSICLDDWDQSAVDIACRQVGLPGTGIVVTDNRFGAPAEPIKVTSLSCSGSEQRLQMCTHDNWAQPGTCASGNAAAAQCQVDGMWSRYTAWSACSVTCESGTETRTRVCDQPPPLHGGADCPGSDTDQISCEGPPCPGVWLTWGSWNTCDVPCGGGVQLRYRNCTSVIVPCVGSDNDSQACNPSSCPVNGDWRTWTAWDTCSVICGRGSQSRQRECTVPQHGGNTCTGPATESQACNEQECPVDGVWSVWDDWSVCSLTCAFGTRSRSRTCTPPLFGGLDCAGDPFEEEGCNQFSCPVDGQWQPWGDWASCSATCGGGSKSRYRVCTQALHGGQSCPGSDTETIDCGMNPCPVDGIWENWGAWEVCPVSCGGATKSRYRLCIPSQHGGAGCSGSNVVTVHCGTNACPVDGQWTAWTAWSLCSVTCGGGTSDRSRNCTGIENGGVPCPGLASEKVDCGMDPCPIHGSWGLWSSWGTCTTSCGGGRSRRYRFCSEALNGGNNCQGSTEEFENCNTEFCPVDGVWSDWSIWGQCSTTCANGTQTRQRTCAPPQYGGLNCAGRTDEVRGCFERECPVNGVLSLWTEWSACPVSCGLGYRLRNRSCSTPAFGGKPCVARLEDTDPCIVGNCPVDGVFNAWSPWTDCDVTCGIGTQNRRRWCIGPMNGGTPCVGPYSETIECNPKACPVNGAFLSWSGWSECSSSCGGGSKMRFRNCTEVSCSGPTNETRACNEHNCPVDGVLSEWTRWGECTLSCGNGTQKRSRNCTLPQYGGLDCSGGLAEAQFCNTQTCPVDGYFNAWEVWNTCSVTCGDGTQYRNRTCHEPQYGGAACIGDNSEIRTCNSNHCPVDGRWLPWSNWTECDVSCGGGTQERERACVQPMYGGVDCNGSASEAQACNNVNCSVDGVFTTWSSWSQCSQPCGTGTQSRDRSCDGPYFGGLPCDDNLNEVQNCNEQQCPVNGVWLDWDAWSVCSDTCGGGTETRNRVCEGPFHGGDPCPGAASESRACNENPCFIPGDWTAWGPFTPCTATCDGGTKSHSRVCNMTSNGDLTSPCIGNKEEAVPCHTFTCDPALSCDDWLSRGLSVSVDARIDPDGPSGPLVPGIVHCDMDSRPGNGVTIIGHKEEGEHEVIGYEAPGGYELPINYGRGTEVISVDFVSKLVDISNECEQYLSWKCFDASIHTPGQPYTLATTITFFRNRTGGIADYFPGASPGSFKCACGVDNSCADPAKHCNCDSNDPVLREDDGFITNRDDLPVTMFCAGDTGELLEEYGWMDVGPVKCVGMET